MKLYFAPGACSLSAHIALREAGAGFDLEQVDLAAKRTKSGADFRAISPMGYVPALQLDDGSYIAETTVMCEYLEERFPNPSIIGATAEERANNRMWMRRIELNITENIYNGFRFAEGIEIFKNRVHCIPAAAADLKATAQEWLAKIDGLMNGRDFIGGNKLSLADIGLYCCMDFAKDVGQPINPELKNISAWFKRVDGRPSATASLHPAWTQVKMRG